VPDLIVAVRAIIEAATGNPRLPRVSVVLVPLEAALDELEKAQVASETRAAGTIAVRDAKLVAVRAALNAYKAFVQKLADANLEEAASLIESAGLSSRRPSSRKKLPFTAKHGRISGQVILDVLAAADNTTYYWQWSANGGLTWNDVETTKQSRTMIDGLPVGKAVLFRYRALTTKALGDWSDVISLLVN
jgi:hypothetical protein